MNKAAPAVLGALVLLLATACGGDDASDKLTATITTSMAEAITSADGILQTDDAACVAKRFVDELGAEKLQELKVVTADGAYNQNGANVDATTSAVYAESILGCVDEAEATAKIRKNLISGSSGASIAVTSTKCYVQKLVATVDLEHLMSARIITDTGALSQNAAAPDPETAAKSTAALLDCIDYYALDAKERAAQTKGLSAATYAACLRRTLPETLLSKFLTAVQAEGQELERKRLGEQVNKKTEACIKVATK